jgi:DeoR family transcriptional regulator of aga operon
MKSILLSGDISVSNLVDEIGSPAPNIRRDLARLEKRGLIRRTHGGATLVEPMLYEPFRHDTSFQARDIRYADEKRRIGLAAAQLISEREVVGMNASTTTTQVGRSLRHRQGISVITNALNIGMELCNQPAIKTTLTGGSIAWVWTFALIGQSTLNSLKDVYLDKTFIGVTGIDLERGVTTLEPEEAYVSQAMIHQAKQVIVVADSSKIGNVSSARICPLSAVHTLVTDSGISEEAFQAFTAKGINVIRA